MTTTLVGHITDIFRDRSYGVLEDDRGHRWLFFEDSTPQTFGQLNIGQRVTFRLVETRKGPVAEVLIP